MRGVLSVIGRFPDGRVIYMVPGSFPAFGYIAFGVIDRGTNVLQARPTTLCPQRCAFCSVDAGLESSSRWAEFLVEPELIVRGVEEAVRVKGGGIEVLLDSMGDVLTYPWLVNLVEELKGVPGVSSVALETHGLLLSKTLIDRLNNAGLDRINLSIDTVSDEKAYYLYGTRYYSVSRIMKLAEYIARETSIDLHVTPLWLPGVNDDDVTELVKWAVQIGAGKKWPPVTIQKYVRHKRGRKLEGVREVSWREFWAWISRVEEETGLKLHWTMEEWGMRYTKRLALPARRGDRITVEVAGRGLFKGEYLGVAEKKGTSFLVAVFPGRRLLKPGSMVTVEVIEDRDGLITGRALND
ncbi:MAG: radical SAM protein [Desulfurococcus sp.]|nr:radical SAM protein [Desulfurococcus sp.]